MRRGANTPTAEPLFGEPMGEPQGEPFGEPVAKAPRSAVQKIYTVTLASLALIAAGYLAILVGKPDMLTSILSGGAGSGIETGSVGEPVFDTEAEISALRTSVTQLQTDVARTRSDVSVLAKNDRAFESSIGAIENKIDGLSEVLRQQAVASLQTAPAETASAPDRSSPGPGATERTSNPPPLAAADPAPQEKSVINPAPDKAPEKPAAKSAEKTKVVERKSARVETSAEAAAPAKAPQLETGSIEAIPAPAKPAKPYGLRILSNQPVDSLRLYWSMVSEQHGGDLGGLNPRYVTGDDSQSFNLVAGPIGSKADARRKCKQLTEKGVSCSVTEFGGNAL